MSIFSGPMAEPSESYFWKSSYDKGGGHYNIFHLNTNDGMGALHNWFPGGKADEFNFVLFSTSGVHGSYTTIEDAELYLKNPTLENNGNDNLTFLIIEPRIVCLRYGNAKVTLDDIEFLKKLRASSWEVITKIGVKTKEYFGQNEE